MNLEELAKDIEKISEYMSVTSTDNSSDIDKYKQQITLGNEQVKKNYVVMLFFSANAFIKSGADSVPIFWRLFSLTNTIHPQTLSNVESVQAIIQQSLTLNGDSIKENVTILRQHGVVLPLFYDMFLMLRGRDSKAMDFLITLSKKDVFGLGDIVEKICHEADDEKRIADFADIVRQKEEQKRDKEYSAELNKIEKETADKSVKIRYQRLYEFHKKHNEISSIVRCADSLYEICKGENNVSDAILWLKRSIEHGNSPEKRKQFRELFKTQCPKDAKDPERFLYEKAVEYDINGALDDINAYDKAKLSSAPKKTAPPPPPPVHNTTSSNTGNDAKAGCGCLIIIGLVILGAVVFYFISSDSSDDEQKQTVIEEKVDENKTTQPDKPDYMKSQKTELSLGGLDLGIDEKQVHDILGAEKSKEEKDKKTILKYDHVDVELQDGKVSCLISNTADALTLRGIHQGSTLHDVIKEYGESPSKFDSGGLTLYEYKFTTLDNRDGIVRFAIVSSDNTVDYISIRIPDSPTTSVPPASEVSPKNNVNSSQNDGSQSSASSTSNNKISNADIQSAEKRLDSFFRHRIWKDAESYKMLSSQEQKRIGNVSNFHSIYPPLDRIDVKDITLDSLDQDSITFSYSIETSRNLHVKGKSRSQTVHQAISGKVRMIKEFGAWYVGSDESTVISERVDN